MLFITLTVYHYAQDITSQVYTEKEGIAEIFHTNLRFLITLVQGLKLVDN